MSDNVLGASLQEQRAFLTLQQIFDKSLSGVRAQGGPSMDENGDCRYRSVHEGRVRACGVGHLIPDNAYDEGFDLGTYGGIKSVSALARTCPEFRAALRVGGVNPDGDKVRDLLISLQSAHDTASNSEGPHFLPSFENQMAFVAKHYNLTYTPPAA